MNSRNYHLTLVAGNVTFLSFMLVGSLRLLLSDPLFYLLGAEHGEAGKRWLDRKVEGSGTIMSKLEQWFPRISWLLVFAAPNNIICLLAGVTGMSKKVFAALNITGTVGRLLLIWWFAERIQDQLSWVLDFFTKYKFQLTAFTIAAVGLQIWMTIRKDSGEVQDLLELEHDIEEVESKEKPS